MYFPRPAIRCNRNNCGSDRERSDGWSCDFACVSRYIAERVRTHFGLLLTTCCDRYVNGTATVTIGPKWTFEHGAANGGSEPIVTDAAERSGGNKGGKQTFAASANHPSRGVGSRHSGHPKLGLALRCRKSALSPLSEFSFLAVCVGSKTFRRYVICGAAVRRKKSNIHTVC